jgi:hypothetical protein
MDTKIDLVYSTDENRRLTIFGKILNETDSVKKDFKVTLGATHPITK